MMEEHIEKNVVISSALAEGNSAASEIGVAEVVQMLPIYQKCLDCPDLGKSCTGKKLSDLGSTEAVRNYHRLLRISRKIPFSRIYAAAPNIGHGTINDYFGRGRMDFKLTTALAIDSALVAICGDRVGLPPLEGFCPADAADLRERNEALSSRLSEAEAEIARLTDMLRNAEASNLAQMQEQRAVFSEQISFATDRMKESDARSADYLRRIDNKSAQIAELNQEVRRLNSEILRMASNYASETKSMVDRVIKMSEVHSEDLKAFVNK